MSQTTMTHCYEPCCVDSLEPIMPGECGPVFIEMGDWLESINSQSLDASKTCIEVTIGDLGRCPEDTTPLQWCDVRYDHSESTLSFNMFGGTAGVGYQIKVSAVTCEGHIGIYCFKQYVKGC